jgi:hypothetical protein
MEALAARANVMFVDAAATADCAVAVRFARADAVAGGAAPNATASAGASIVNRRE